MEKSMTKQESIKVGFETLEGSRALWNIASSIAQATMIPKQYQGNQANCLIALNMANRMNADPLMVMQNLYTVNGNPSWSSKFLIATFNTCGRYSSLRYEMTGEIGKDSWGCRAWSIEKCTDAKLVGAEVTVKMAKDEGWYNKPDRSGKNISKWPTMTELMLQYRAAAFFVRVYAPELSAGLLTKEEVDDIAEPKKVEEYEAMQKEVEEKQAVKVIDITETEDSKPDPEQEQEQQQESEEEELGF